MLRTLPWSACRHTEPLPGFLFALYIDGIVRPIADVQQCLRGSRDVKAPRGIFPQVLCITHGPVLPAQQVAPCYMRRIFQKH